MSRSPRPRWVSRSSTPIGSRGSWCSPNSDADSVTEIGNCRVLTVRPGRPVEELVGVVGLFLTGESIDLE
jgi:hypothetical protein